MIAAGFWDEGLLFSGGCVVLVRVNLWLELVVSARLVPKHRDAVGAAIPHGLGRGATASRCASLCCGASTGLPFAAS
jgi:hypothetical protein